MEFALPIAIAPVVPRRNQSPALYAEAGFLHHFLDHFVPHHRNNYHPHIFSHRMTALLSLLLVSVKIFGIATLSMGPVESVFSSAITPTNIISLTNQSRAELSLPALLENSVLAKAAQAKADDMLAKGYFAHNAPDGKTPWDFVTAAGYNYLSAGENLAVNFTEAENVEDAWMNSPGHKANIVNKNFQEIGIGIAQGEYQGHTAIFVVQMFGAPAEQKVALEERPTIVQTQTVPVPVEGVRASAEKVLSEKTFSVPEQSAGPVAVAENEVPVIPVSIIEQHAEVSGQSIIVSVKTNGPAVKVMAVMGQEGVILEPKGDNAWEGSLSLAHMANEEYAVMVKAFDMNGNYQVAQVAEFAGSTPANFAEPAAVQGSKSGTIHFMKWNFSPKGFENNFFLIFAAALLASLMLAIAIHRHVQHITLVANGSFVVMLAVLLWAAG